MSSLPEIRVASSARSRESPDPQPYQPVIRRNGRHAAADVVILFPHAGGGLEVLSVAVAGGVPARMVRAVSAAVALTTAPVPTPQLP